MSPFPCCLERPSCLASSALAVEVLLLPALESRLMATKLGKCCDLFDGNPDGVLNLRISRASERCLQFGSFLSIDWRKKPNVGWGIDSNCSGQDSVNFLDGVGNGPSFRP